MDTRPDHEPQRADAGCPPVLATDVSRNDVVEPIVEWPPGPPSRDGHRRTSHAWTGPRQDATAHEDSSGDETVAQLAAGRAVRLLETSIEHLRTVLETSEDADTAACVERAIQDVTDAAVVLHEFGQPKDLSTNV